MVCDTWFVHQDEVVISQLSEDSCNSLAESLWVPVVLQVHVVSVNGELVG